MSFEEPDPREKLAKDYCTEYINRFEILVRSIVHDVLQNDELSRMALKSTKETVAKELFEISMNPYT